MANLQTPPHAIFNQIQSNLRDRYKSGFPVLKELIQNAEDAESLMVRFIAHSGWADAKNPLLRVPGLLVVNDGQFRKKDEEGILSFAASAKGDETAAIGRFGFGQKAVFHLCDAFVAHTFGHDVQFSQVINPCLDVIPNTQATTWDSIEPEDLARLEAEVREIAQGFLIWVPLRCEAILPASRLYFTEARPTLGELIQDFKRHEADLCLVLASARHIDRIEMLHEGRSCVALSRETDSARMQGPDKDGRCATNCFADRLVVRGGRRVAYVGREAGTQSARLAALGTADEWPQSPVLTAQGIELKKEKAVAHGAVILAACGDASDDGELLTTLDWGVFLPVAKAAQIMAAAPALKLLMHGYFFVDSGRSHIEGFGTEAAAESITVKWNVGLRDDVVLPLLPSVLQDAFEAQILSSGQLAAVVTALRDSQFGRIHAAALAARDGLVRVLVPVRSGWGARWKLVSSMAILRPLPAPDARDRIEAVELFPNLVHWADKHGLTLVCGPEAALVREAPAWAPEELAKLLALIGSEVYVNASRARTLADFLAVSVGEDDDRRAAVAGPLLGALRQALAGSHSMGSEDGIRRILAFLPPGVAIGLPKAAGERRDVLRALAGVKDALPCLRGEWLPESAVRRDLILDEAAPLLAAIAPLLQNQQAADAAGAAALAILRLLGPQIAEAVRDPDLAVLRILRAGDGSGCPRLVTLAELVRASNEGRLFRDSPNVQRFLKALSEAVLDADALVLGGDAARQLEEIGAPFAFAEARKDSFARVVARAIMFGTAPPRARLLGQAFNEATEARGALRALAAGDARAQSDGMRLFALSQRQTRLDGLALRLIAGSAQDLLVPAEIVDSLSRTQVSHLGIEILDGPALGRLLRAHMERLAEGACDDETLAALLESDVPDADLAVLPIFPATKGTWHEAGRIWCASRDWQVPAAMAEIVPLLRSPAKPLARERAEKLVHPWSPEAQIRASLNEDEPHHLAAEILSALAQTEAPRLIDKLRQAPWLTDYQGRAWKPDDVLDLPEDVLLVARESLGRGDDLPFLPLSELPAALREAPGFEKLRRFHILPDLEGAFDRLLLIVEDRCPVAWMGEEGSSCRPLAQLAAAGANLKLPGWPLLAALLRGTDRDRSALLRAFGTVRQDHAEQAVEWLNALADLAACENEAARAAYVQAFRLICGWPSDLLREVMAEVRVPVRTGAWRPALEVVAGVEGIAPAHRLDEALEDSWPDQRTGYIIGAVGEAQPAEVVPPESTGLLNQQEVISAQSLIPVVERAAADLPPEVLALLIGVVRRIEPFRDIVRSLGLTEGVIDRLWDSLRIKVDGAFIPTLPGQRLENIRQRTLLQFRLERPRSIKVETLVGATVMLPTAALEPLMVIGDGHRRRRSVELDAREYWLRQVIIADADGPIGADHIRRLIRTLAEECLGYQTRCLDVLEELVDDYLKVEQVTVEDACARIRDRLPQLVAELKPPRGTALRKALEGYETAEQRLSPGTERDKGLPELKEKFWARVLEPETIRELLQAVRDRIVEFGYYPGRTLFELFQNADDANVQHPPDGEARFCLEVDSDRVRALHWGRLINHPGPDPQAGEREGWQRDLFNMLLMNLSEKREEVTGRFGLGFKSVHLIAGEVGIASGFVACRVRGGMLPEVWEGGRRVSRDHTAEGRRATSIDLEIDPHCRDQAKAALAEFRRVVRWLPVMSRAIRKIEINGDDGGIWSADLPRTVAEGIAVVTLRGPQTGRALALDLGQETTLYLPLDSDGVVPADEGLPRLWVLAPIERSIATAWLLNGMHFRVDPGRGQLGGTEDEQQELFARLGAVLGTRLVALHDIVRDNWRAIVAAAALADPGPETGGMLFLKRLADLFVLDLSDPLARHLHGPKRGFGRLIADRSALPTGLPPPFAQFVRAGDVKHELPGALVDTGLLTELTGWKAINTIGQCSVSGKVAMRLGALGFDRPPPYGIVEILHHEIGPERRIDPLLAGRLGRALTEERLRQFTWQDQANLKRFVASAEFLMTDGAWRTAALPPNDANDADDEERRVLAFAPDRVVAASGYVGQAIGLYRFARRQSGFQQTAREFAGWAGSESRPNRQKALLRYVVEGRQGSALAAELAHLWPGWLPETSDGLRNSALVDGWLPEDLAELLSLLYPGENRKRWATDFSVQVPGSLLDDEPEIDPRGFLEQVHDWWERAHQEERQRHDRIAYPDGFLPSMLSNMESAIDREGWFTFFALGVFRTIGRSHEGAHRNFIAAAQQSGWWAEMAQAKLPDDPRPWISRLEDFARADAWRIDYPQWRKALVDLYVLARWLPDYVDAFRSLPALVRQGGNIRLSDAWRLSASPLWQRRGLEGAPLTQSLGPGANWLIREAIRHGLWQEDDAMLMQRYGWAATARLRTLFWEKLGCSLDDTATMDLSPDIFGFVQQHLNDRADFLGDLDLPLQIVADGRRDSFWDGPSATEEFLEDEPEDDLDVGEVIE